MNSPRVLVVEDVPDLLDELVDYLRYFDFDAYGENSIAGMQNQLLEKQWDVLVLDLGLPDGDGLVAARQVRQEHGFKVGIIMVTARGQIEDRIAGLAGASADAYLVKPVNLRELKAVIDQLVARIRDAGAVKSNTAWSIDELTMQLRCPGGVSVQLTGTEVLLLKHLFDHKPGVPLSRDLLSKYLAPSGTPPNSRRLDTLISRLRSKVEQQAGLPLPIWTFRNLGYLFTGALER
ncbi:MAG: response regulator transcription factor [Aquisalimonadaceae bacterium]